MTQTAARRLAALVLVALQAGCTHPSYYGDAERRFGTDRFFASQGHFAVYYPTEIALDFPGYVVGVELSDRRNVLRDGDLIVDHFDHAGSTITRLTSWLRDGRRNPNMPHYEDRVPFISHVLRYTDSPRRTGNCALYSVYQSAQPELMDFCGGERRPRIDDWSRYDSAFADSWSAVDALKRALERDVESGDHTHLIVAVLGWRTPQEEAMRSFKSVMHTVQRAAGDDFRPLFVGVTWVGPWAGRWFDPLIETFAYVDIADLADELGLTWLGVLTDEVFLPLSDKLSTVFVTHSFGARAASLAVCVGPAIRRSETAVRTPASGSIERLIGFQAAFSLQRFHEKPLIFFYEDIHFPNDCERARSIVLTTSRHDAATRMIIWADLAGNYRYFKSFCQANARQLASCTSVDENGVIRSPYDDSRKVLYLDATDLISYKAPGSEGGAHSDIFRPAVGRMIWGLISQPPSRGNEGAQ